MVLNNSYICVVKYIMVTVFNDSILLLSNDIGKRKYRKAASESVWIKAFKNYKPITNVIYTNESY